MAANEQVNIIIKAKDEATATLRNVNSSLGGIGSSLTNVVAGYASLGIAVKVVKDIVAAAAEEEKQWNRVTAALKSAKYEYQSALPIIKQMTDNLEWQTGTADELIAQGFNRLLPIVKNVGEAYKILNAAADIAAAKDVDLTTVVEALIGAYQGHSTQLERLTKTYFPDAIKGAAGFEEQLAILQKQFDGQAKAKMAGWNGEVERFGLLWEHFKERVGAPFLKEVGSALEHLANMGVGPFSMLAPGKDESDALAKAGEDLKKANEAAYDLGITINSIALGPDLKDTAAVFRENAIAVSTLNRELDSLSDLPPIDMGDIYGMGSEDDMDLSRLRFRQMVQNWQDVRRAADESARAQQRAMDRVASAAQRVLDPLQDWILAGQSISATFAAMGQRIKQIIVEQIINSLAQAIAQALFFKAVTAGITGGFGGGFGIGQQAMSILPFDNRNNDSMLQREVMWVGQLITRGITAGMQREIPLSQPAMATSGAAPNITIQFNGPVTSEKFVNDTILPAIERAVRLNKTSVKVNNTHLTGKRDGFSY